MADENPTDQGAAEPPTPEVQDFRDQSVVLTLVLSSWPVHLTLDDLVREIVADSENFTERDRVARAVRDLVGAGLAHHSGSLVLPTRAALRFSRLWEEGL